MNSPQKNTKSAPKNTGALEAITLRNDFYKDGYRTAQTTNVLLALTLLVSIALNFYQASKPKPKPDYFATTPNGSLIPMKPLDDPLLSVTQLTNWVSTAVAKAYTIDAKNYVKQVQDNARFFTYDGFTQYKNALEESGQLKLIKEKIMITSAVPAGAPVVLDTLRTPDGVLFWKMQMPLVVQYASAKESYVQSVTVNLVVTRIPTTESVDGVAITQIVARPTQGH